MIAQQYGYPYYNPAMYQQPAPMPQQQPVQQQIRSGGIVSVSSEEEARRYPVAPGYTVTMRDENAPYLYEKQWVFRSSINPFSAKHESFLRMQLRLRRISRNSLRWYTRSCRSSKR